MAKIAFWITAGPDQAQKALSALILAQRLRTVRHQQDVEVYLFGPGVALITAKIPAIQQALAALKEAAVSARACPANVQQMGLDEQAVSATGVVLEPAGLVLVDLVEQGYQIIGV